VLSTGNYYAEVLYSAVKFAATITQPHAAQQSFFFATNFIGAEADEGASSYSSVK
jgi:hypothetical protein